MKKIEVLSGYRRDRLTASVVLSLGETAVILSPTRAREIAFALEDAAESAETAATAKRQDCEDRGLEPERDALLELAAKEPDIDHGLDLSRIALESDLVTVQQVLREQLEAEGEEFEE